MSKVVVIAAGGGSFVPKKPSLDTLEAFDQPDHPQSRILYAVRDPDLFVAKHVVIAGGGDSALDWALLLAPKAQSVTLAHRRRQFRAAPKSVAKLMALEQAGKVSVQVGQITQLHGDPPLLEAVSIDDQQIRADYLLIFYGMTMRLGALAQFGLESRNNLLNVDTARFETSRKGIFAIGDINTYPGKLKLILSGFHEAALAARACFEYVYPERKYRFLYTTTSSALQQKLNPNVPNV